jgi:hypothetical protein
LIEIKRIITDVPRIQYSADFSLTPVQHAARQRKVEKEKETLVR